MKQVTDVSSLEAHAVPSSDSHISHRVSLTPIRLPARSPRHPILPKQTQKKPPSNIPHPIHRPRRLRHNANPQIHHNRNEPRANLHTFRSRKPHKPHQPRPLHLLLAVPDRLRSTVPGYRAGSGVDVQSLDCTAECGVEEGRREGGDCL